MSNHIPNNAKVPDIKKFSEWERERDVWSKLNYLLDGNVSWTFMLPYAMNLDFESLFSIIFTILRR